MTDSIQKWRITSEQGVCLGTYTAESEEAALDAMAVDAGYQSQEHAAAVAGEFEGTCVPVGWTIAND